MSRDPRNGEELDARGAEVLRTVIRRHVASGGPVGSRAVAEGAKLELSPASIRAVMADLEERGLLRRHHASAGRVPTDRAYRVYVQQVLEHRPRVAAAQAQVIDRALINSRAEVPEMLEEASRQLSKLSNQVGLVLAPDMARVIVDRIEFVPLNSRRVMAILGSCSRYRLTLSSASRSWHGFAIKPYS